MLRPAPEVVRAVRIRPRGPACVALTFVFTAYPGVLLHAGLLHDFAYPACGCDACDEVWTTEADEMERQVLAAVTGHYRESIDDGHSVEHAFTYPDGATSGWSDAAEFPADRLDAARLVLRELTDGWAPWPAAG